MFPDVYENGIRYLEEVLGLRVKEFPTARMNAEALYRNPQVRAQDINSAFGDPEVQAIISTIGGDDSIRILEYLDLPVILENPKILMGYSDTTTLLCYLNMHGLRTYYGNSIMAGFSYLYNFPDAQTEYQSLLFENSSYTLNPFSTWADAYEPWGDRHNVGKVSRMNTHDHGHRWLHKGQSSRGQLWGGCIEVLVMMTGTFAWPAPDFWDGRILMLETSEDSPSPEEVGFILRNFGVQGIFYKIAGLLVAKPKGYTEKEKRELDDVILRIVAGEFGCRNLNIISNIEFGHTDPRHIMPLGAELRIDPGRERLGFTERIFA